MCVCVCVCICINDVLIFLNKVKVHSIFIKLISLFRYVLNTPFNIVHQNIININVCVYYINYICI